MSSKFQAVSALSLKGGTTGRRPVLPPLHQRYYRFCPVLKYFGTEFCRLAPGVTQHYRALPVVPCCRYYRTVYGTTALPHAVLPLRPVLQDFSTDVLGLAPGVAQHYRALPVVPGARYYRVRPVVPRFFMRHYRGLPVVQVLPEDMLLVHPSTTEHRAVLPLKRYYRMRTVVLWAGSAPRRLTGRYYRTPCGSTGVSDFLPNGWISCGLLYKLKCSTPRGSSPSIKDTHQDPLQELTKSIITPNPSNQTRRSLED